MISWQIRFLLMLLASYTLTVATGSLATADHHEFESLFDGKSLENWDGNPKFWSVQDGAITGQTTAENPTKGNTFIIWRGGDVGNFELRLKYRIVNGNSGIQYRAQDHGNWVVGGYQADFEAGKTYSGILYDERGRGILANRGQMTVVRTVTTDDGKTKHAVEVVGNLGESDDIQSVIKSEDWNDYKIIAADNRFTHIINGRVTSVTTDLDAPNREARGILALQLHAGPPMTVQFKDIQIRHFMAAGAARNASSDNSKSEEAKKKVVLVAGRPSHGYGSHEHNAGCMLLAHHLRDAFPSWTIDVHRNGWPADPQTAFEGADTIVMYCDGGGRHMVIPNQDAFDKLMKKGVGVVCLHYAVEVPKGDIGEKFKDWLGGYFEPHWSVNPHWTANFESLPDHPISRGVEPFSINDEWYFHMRFRDDMQGVIPILTAVAPEKTMSRPDGPHSGNPHVRAAVAKHVPQHVAWAVERSDGGRGFGFTGGHFHWNWGDENFRTVVLNAITWTAHASIPADGVGNKAPLPREVLEQNQNFPKPKPKQNAN